MDCKGVMGLPMRIVLAFLIIALCIPTLVSAASDFSQQADINGMDDDLDRISEAATKAYLGGSGTVIKTYVELTPGYEIVLGGDEADRYTVKLMHSGEVVEKRYLAHPTVPVLEKMTIDGSGDILIECVSDPGYGVKVTSA